MTSSPSLSLRNGVSIPQIGLGVWQSGRGDQTYNAVRMALDAGYRHIDTARVYGNEADVGRAVRDSGIARHEVFVTTKLWNEDQASAQQAFEQSLRRLDLEYIDLYLIHWPVPETRTQAWAVLEAISAGGKCRAIGVSNYTIAHLEELVKVAKVLPSVNQVELHPFLYQRALIEYCKAQGIVVQAYSPLTHGKRLDHPLLGEIGARHGKTPAQVLIRWCIDHGLVVLPKSVKKERIEENIDVFDFSLSADERLRLDGLHENLRTCWDPTPVR